MVGLGHQHRTVAKSKNWVDWAGAPGKYRARDQQQSFVHKTPSRVFLEGRAVPRKDLGRGGAVP